MASQPARTHEEIEAQVREMQSKKAATAGPAANGQESGPAGVPLTASTGLMDQAIYGVNDKFAEYVSSIAANDDADDDDDDQAGIENGNGSLSITKSVHATAAYLKDVVDQVCLTGCVCDRYLIAVSSVQDHDPLAENRVSRVIDREDEYRRRYRKAVISPERADPFLEGQYSFFLCLCLSSVTCAANAKAI